MVSPGIKLLNLLLLIIAIGIHDANASTSVVPRVPNTMPIFLRAAYILRAYSDSHPANLGLATLRLVRFTSLLFYFMASLTSLESYQWNSKYSTYSSDDN